MNDAEKVLDALQDERCRHCDHGQYAHTKYSTEWADEYGTNVTECEEGAACAATGCSCRCFDSRDVRNDLCNSINTSHCVYHNSSHYQRDL